MYVYFNELYGGAYLLVNGKKVNGEISKTYGSVETNKWYRVILWFNQTTDKVSIEFKSYATSGEREIDAYIDNINVYCKKTAEDYSTNYPGLLSSYTQSPICNSTELTSWIQSKRSSGWESIVIKTVWWSNPIPEQKTNIEASTFSQLKMKDYPVPELKITKPPAYYINPDIVEFEIYFTNNYTVASYCSYDLYSIDNATYIFQGKILEGTSSPHPAFAQARYPPYYDAFNWAYGYGSFEVIYHCYDAKNRELTDSKTFQVLSEMPTYDFTVTPSSDEFDCSYGVICQRSYKITNTGTADLTITISSDQSWIQPQVSSVFVASGDEVTVTVNYDSTYGSVGDTLSGNLIFHEDHVGDKYVAVTMHIVGVFVPTIGDVSIVEAYPTKPFLTKNFTVVVTVKNLDSVTRSFKLGLSLGEDYVKQGAYWYLEGDHWCNSECYLAVTDTNVSIVSYPPTPDYPLGEKWIEIYNMTPNEVRTIYITLNAKEYDPVSGQGFFGGEVLDLAVALRDYDDVSTVYDWEEKDDFITIREGIIFAYPFRVKVDKSEVNIGETITIRAWVENNGTQSHNFTLGLSIGLWDATNDTIYTYPRDYLVPPCNKECYRDGKGDWLFLIIPPDYSAYFERTLIIPDYFLVNTSYDVAVGVWREPPDGDLTKGISFRYFKGVIKVVGVEKPTELIVGESIKMGLDMIVSMISIGFGIDTVLARYIFWSFMTAGIMGGLAYVFRGSQFGIMVSIIVGLLLLVGGALIGYFPSWLTIILVLIGGFIFASIGKGVFLK